MTKTEALHEFMSSFGLKAYPRNAVPKEAKRPYLTYDKGMSPAGFSSTVRLYYLTESESVPDAKAEDICSRLRPGGKQIHCAGGTLWIALETPEWYSGNDPEDFAGKLRIINILITDQSQ